jgi:nucleoside-diphosphate-sugar epimerase
MDILITGGAGFVGLKFEILLVFFFCSPFFLHSLGTTLALTLLKVGHKVNVCFRDCGFHPVFKR